MSWDKINLGDVVQGVWDNYYYLVVSIDKSKTSKDYLYRSSLQRL